jgi:hypothetical protein
MSKIINITIPEWAFLDGNTHDGNLLEKRVVIFHSKSLSVIEMFNRDSVVLYLEPGVPSYKFKNTHTDEPDENLIAVVHYCAKFDTRKERERIKRDILIPCAKWYCEYCEWEDRNIASDMP